MKSSSRANGQLNLGPLPLADRKHDEAALPNHAQASSRADSPDSPRVNRKHENAPLPKCTQREDAQRIAAELFDEALTHARIETGEVAYILGISESLVRRMRSTDARECVSSVQLLMMPPRVQFEFIAAWYRRQGFGRAVLARVLDSIGLLSLSVER